MRRFPASRLRRNRDGRAIRALVAESRLDPAALLLPLFVSEEEDGTPVDGMPGVGRHGIESACAQATEAWNLGIRGVFLFPRIPAAMRDPEGSQAVDPDTLIARTLRVLRARLPEMLFFCDVALDPYTSHGHDGLLVAGRVDNDQTLDVLARQAVVLAQAGCDTVAPSDMMDGRVGVIRRALDSEGYGHVRICSYAAKYASHLYGPFRDALGVPALEGDKRSYQMDPANGDEACEECALDVAEGADLLIVKPGTPYLDVLCRVSRRFALPTLAYQVSGEYAMIRAAAAGDPVLEANLVDEMMLGFFRAGARGVISYFALDCARRWREGQ